VLFWSFPETKETTVYVGDWVSGQREGRGNCYWHAGDQYEGEWKDDKSHGQGVAIDGCVSSWRNECGLVYLF
jgi:hypothetical protein